MKISKLHYAVVSILVVIGAKAALSLDLMKPEAAAPLVGAVVFIGFARIGVAAIRRFGHVQRTPMVRDHIILSHGEIA